MEKYKEYAILVNNRLIYYRENIDALMKNFDRNWSHLITESDLIHVAEEIRSALRNQQGFCGVSVDIDALEPDHERVVVIDIQPEHDIEIVVTPWNRFVADFITERSKGDSETN